MNSSTWNLGTNAPIGMNSEREIKRGTKRFLLQLSVRRCGNRHYSNNAVLSFSRPDITAPVDWA